MRLGRPLAIVCRHVRGGHVDPRSCLSAHVSLSLCLRLCPHACIALRAWRVHARRATPISNLDLITRFSTPRHQMAGKLPARLTASRRSASTRKLEQPGGKGQYKPTTSFSHPTPSCLHREASYLLHPTPTLSHHPWMDHRQPPATPKSTTGV